MAITKKRFRYHSSPEYWFLVALELNKSVQELYSIGARYVNY